MPKTSSKGPFYELPEESNGKALQEARRVRGLDEEIALLRARLRELVREGQASDRSLLAAINTLSRAVLTQARVGTDGLDAANARIAAVVRQLTAALSGDETKERSE